MIDNLGFALDSAWRVLLVGLLLGAGLPVLFACGIRSLAWAAGKAETSDRGPRALGKALAALCFTLVTVAVALGITVIVAQGLGRVVSFEHGYPTLVATS